MLKNNPRSILKLVKSNELSQIHSDNVVVIKEIEETSPAIQKMDRKVCRLCAKLKPADFLFPFYGTDYEQIVHNFLPFGLCIEKDDGLPTEVCQTCSRKLLNCKHTVERFIEADKKLKLLLPTIKGTSVDNETINLIGDTNSDEVQSKKILLVEVKQEATEIVADKLEAEMEIENEVQILTENSPNMETEMKNEIFITETDPSNGIMNAGYEEVVEFNEYEDVIVKVEPNDIQMIESEEESVENADLEDLTAKKEGEKSDDLPDEISENNSRRVDKNPHPRISWVELFECCDCKKRYITKEAVISHITNIHAKGEITYHAKFEAVRVNIRNNSTNSPSPSEEVNKRQIYHHVVRPTLNKTEKNFFTCNICGLTVKQNNILKEHMERHRRDLNDQACGIYRCNVCKKTMRSQHLLKCHGDLHNGVQFPFACEKCDEKFSEYQKWYVHQRIHTGDRPFGCKICDKTFRTKQTMSYHVTRVHMNGKQYQCLSCRKQFKYMSALTYHVKNLECKTLFAH